MSTVNKEDLERYKDKFEVDTKTAALIMLLEDLDDSLSAINKTLDSIDARLETIARNG